MRHSLEDPSSAGLNPEWRSALRLVPHLLQERSSVVLALVLLALAKAATLVTPWLLKLLVDGLSADALNLALPLGIICAYAGLRLAGGWLGEWRDLVFARVTERTMRRVSVQVFAHLQSLDLDFHQSRQTGSLSRDIERGVSGIRFLLRFMLFNILPTLIEIAAVAVILVSAFGWLFGMVMIVAVVAYIAWTVAVTEWRTRHVRTSMRMDSQAHGRAVDALLNFETVKYFGAEERELKRYDRELEDWEGAMRSSRISLAVLNAGQALIIAVALLGMLILAGMAVVDGRQTAGDFVMVNAYLVSLFTPLNFLGFVYREIKASLVAVQRLFSLLDIAPTIADAQDAVTLQLQAPPRVDIDELHYAYDPARPILKGISIAVEPGTTTAIVGPSGSGKSTLAKLLFRFYDPQAGQISLNGLDLRAYQLQSLRANIGVVPQDTVLLNDTIAHNIAYGRPDSSPEQLAEAAQGAALDSLLEAAPEGLDTLVGERGMKVSGGEKQRIALARVLLKNPRLLILDEATSSLDSQAEASVMQTLREAMQDRTCIAIAHRLSTIRDADNIVVLDQGQVVEQGNHPALLAKQGLYAKLWKEQSREDTLTGADSPDQSA